MYKPLNKTDHFSSFLFQDIMIGTCGNSRMKKW